MTRGARLAIAAWLAGLALCAWQVAHTRFVADLSSFLPAAPTEEQRLLVDQLRDGALSRVVLIGIEGADAAGRMRLSRALAGALASRSSFTSVMNGAEDGFGRAGEFLFAHRYALSPAVTPRRFTVEGLREAIGETIDRLASPAGLALKPLVTRDPTGETMAIAESLQGGSGPRTVSGVWTSADGERAVLLARTRAAGSDTDAQAQAVAEIETAFARAAVEARAPTARLLLSGPGVLSARSRAMIAHDVERIALVSFSIVVVLLLLAYRSPLALALGLVPVASGALAGIAVVSWQAGAVHGITLGFGTTLIGEAVDYSIYLFVQSERSTGAGDDRWVRGFWPTVRLGVLTSIAGFSALLFSGLPGLVQLGVYSIAGLAVAALVTRFVLPALLPARLRLRDLSAAGERIGAMARVAARGRWVVAALCVVAMGVVVAHRDTLWDRELSSLNPVSAQDRAVDAELRAAIGASDARHVIVVRAASAEGALESAERLGARLDALVADQRLGGYESPARFLPSAATQRARLAAIPPAGELRARLKSALAGLPLRPERLEPFIAEADKARAAAPVTREDLAGTALGAAIDGMLLDDGARRWSALVGLQPASGKALDLGAVREAIAAAGAHAMLLDVKSEVDLLYAGYFERALLASAAGFAAIVALLALALRSWLRVARVVVPLVAAVLAVAAGFALAGTSLSLLHLVGLLLVVGIGSNYSLFFDRLAASADDSAAPRTLASLALANATTVASFGVLAQSSIPVLSAIGTTVSIGAFLALAFAAALAMKVRFAHAHPGPAAGET